MALKAQLDKEEDFNALPEAVRSEYKKVEDDEGVRWLLDAEGVEDVTGLKSALEKERTTRRTTEKFLRKLGLKADEKAVTDFMAKLGDQTLEEVIEAATAAKATQTEADAAVGESKKLKKQVGDLTELTTSQSTFIDRLVRENALREVLAKDEHGGNAVLLMPHLLRHTKVVEEDGDEGKEYVAKVIDPKTKEIRMKGAKEMTLDDLVIEVKADPNFADAFPGTGASGSGANPSRNPAGGGTGGRKTTDTPQTKRRESGVGYNQV